MLVRYDTDGKGYVTHEDFLRYLTAEQFAPGDHGGTSQHIMENSHKKLEEHLEDQQAKHEQITFNQAVLTTEWSVDQLLQQLRSVSGNALVSRCHGVVASFWNPNAAILCNHTAWDCFLTTVNNIF